MKVRLERGYGSGAPGASLLAGAGYTLCEVEAELREELLEDLADEQDEDTDEDLPENAGEDNGPAEPGTV